MQLLQSTSSVNKYLFSDGTLLEEPLRPSAGTANSDLLHGMSDYLGLAGALPVRLHLRHAHVQHAQGQVRALLGGGEKIRWVYTVLCASSPKN